MIQRAVTHEGTKRKRSTACSYYDNLAHICSPRVFGRACCLCSHVCVYSPLSLNYSSSQVAQSEHVLSKSRSAMPMHQRSTQRRPGSQLGRVCVRFNVCVRRCMCCAGSVQQWVTWWSFICMSSAKCHRNTHKKRHRFR